jgi:hypothetical protein
MRSRLRLLVAAMPLMALAGCGGGGGGTTAPPPQTVKVSVASSSTSVPVGGSLFFTATVTGTTNQAVTWQVNLVPGGNATVGTINSAGVYSAPAAAPSPAAVTVTAISQADTTKSAFEMITINIAVSPGKATLNISDPVCNSVQGFGASGASGGVNWAVTLNGAPAPSSFGTFAGSQYNAPDAIPDPLAFDVTATSQTDATQTGNAGIILQAGGPGINQSTQASPIKLGTSGGNVNDVSGNSCCSGTLGSLVVRNGTNFILSNNHVLARTGKAQVGEAIGQPGLVDNRCAAGVTVANFTQAVKPNAGGTSAADAAIAQVSSGMVDPTGAILGLGPTNCGVAGAAPPANTTATPAIGMLVAKSGRTSGITCSTISAVSLQVQVQYETTCGSQSTFLVTYNNQIDILSTTFSAPGDSGSLIVDAQTAQPVGLLYAGSDIDTVANPIQDVLTALADSMGHQPTFVGGATHTVPVCTGTNGPFGAVSQSATNVRSLWPSDQEVARVTGIKETHAAALMSDPAIVGVGVGAGAAPGEAVIVIFVDKDKTHGTIPSQLDGVKTRVRLVKHFRAFAAACPVGASRQIQSALR